MATDDKNKSDDNVQYIVYTDKNGKTQRVTLDEYHKRERDGDI